jgi:ribosomal protein S18 acetylase RimI-like enzyme
MNIVIRPATMADKDFIVTAIVEAEKSGGNVISYGGMFDMDEAQVRQLISDMLDEDLPGQEVCVQSFMVAEVEGECVAALGGFIEGEHGMPSSLIKGNLMMHCVPRDILMRSMDRMKLMASITHKRPMGALQLETGYTDPRYRGLRIFRKLLVELVDRRREESQFDTILIETTDNNEVGKNTYQKMGFEITSKKSTDNPDIYKMLASNTKVRLVKHENKIE